MPSTGWRSITRTAPRADRTAAPAAGPAAAADPAPAARPPARAFDLGRLGYLEAARLQHALVEERKRGGVPDTFLFLEHPPVITLGRASADGNLLAPPSVLGARGVEVWETTRGGDVTYHGPGQLVGYGIVDLRQHGRDVARYLRTLEAAVIAFLARHGIAGERHPEYTGVWVGGAKVCALGVRVDHWVTSHGLALNVAPDLSPFDLIVPCGIRGRGVTSLARLAPDTAWRLDAVAHGLAGALAERFGWQLEWQDPAGLPTPDPTTTGRVLGGVRRVFPAPGEK